MVNFWIRGLYWQKWFVFCLQWSRSNNFKHVNSKLMHILGQKTRTCFIRIFEQKIKGLFDITFDHNKPLCSQCSWIRQWAKVCCARLIQIDFGQIQLIFSWWEVPHLKGWFFSLSSRPHEFGLPFDE